MMEQKEKKDAWGPKDDEAVQRLMNGFHDVLIKDGTFINLGVSLTALAKISGNLLASVPSNDQAKVATEFVNVMLNCIEINNILGTTTQAVRRQ